jgi:type IV pilus assembly protein PilC
MVAVGEETARLPEVLGKVATSYESDVDRSMKMLTSLIEPMIILFMGVMVAFIVIAMLMPIFNLDPNV